MPEYNDYQNPYGDQSGATPPPPPPSYRTPQPAQPGQHGTSAQTQTQMPARSGDAGPSVAVSRGRQLLWVALVIVDLLLALHFLFVLTNAGDVGFGHFIYVVGDALNAPFRGLFNVSVTHSGHQVQWADIVAIVVYTIVAWIIDRIIVIFATPGRRSGAPSTPA